MKKITKRAAEAINKEIKNLEHRLRDVQKDIGHHGNDQDGWHGEAYQLMMVEFFTLSEKLKKQKERLKDTEIVDQKNKYDMIEVGAVTEIDINGEVKAFKFDGIAYEADIITPESPIGKAVFKRKSGETVKYQTPSGQKTVKIISVI